jgi:steroid delta-isomerase-like uncharacterized protein
MSIEKNKELVLGFIDVVLQKRDFSKFGDFAAPDYRLERTAAEAIRGKSGLEAHIGMLYDAFPDLDFQVADIAAEEDKVVVRFDVPGTHKAHFAGIAPTGRKVTWKGIEIYYIADNKIKSAWSIWDAGAVIGQLQ